MLELIYVKKIIKFYLDLNAGSKGLNNSSTIEPQQVFLFALVLIYYFFNI